MGGDRAVAVAVAVPWVWLDSESRVEFLYDVNSVESIEHRSPYRQRRGRQRGRPRRCGKWNLI
jgi:hypothetical protein